MSQTLEGLAGVGENKSPDYSARRSNVSVCVYIYTRTYIQIPSQSYIILYRKMK